MTWWCSYWLLETVEYRLQEQTVKNKNISVCTSLPSVIRNHNSSSHDITQGTVNYLILIVSDARPKTNDNTADITDPKHVYFFDRSRIQMRIIHTNMNVTRAHFRFQMLRSSFVYFYSVLAFARGFVRVYLKSIEVNNSLSALGNLFYGYLNESDK